MKWNCSLHMESVSQNTTRRAAPRGRVFSADTIGELISIRDFTVGLAESGINLERTAGYGKKERKAFADSLDRQLHKLQTVLVTKRSGKWFNTDR